MPNLTSLTVLLRGDSTSLVKATKVGLGAIKGFGKAVGKTALIGGALGAGALAGAAAGLVKLGNAARDSIDAHAKNAARLGLTVTEAQKLEQAAGQSDVKMKTLTVAMAAIGREAGMAAAGSKKAAQKFLDLGLSMDEVKNASPYELLTKVIGALGDISDPAERAAKGSKLIGDSWIKLNPLIAAGNAAFSDANVIFDKLGLGLGDNAGKVETFNDKLDSLSRLGVALRDKVFATLAPKLAEFSTKLFDAAAAFIMAQGGGEKLATTLATGITEGIKSVIDWFGDLKTAISGVLEVAQFLVDVIQGIGVIGAGVAAAAGALVDGNFSGAGAVLGSIPGDVAAQFKDENSDEQLQEAKRTNNLLEDIGRTFGPVFQ